VGYDGLYRRYPGAAGNADDVPLRVLPEIKVTVGAGHVNHIPYFEAVKDVPSAQTSRNETHDDLDGMLPARRGGHRVGAELVGARDFELNVLTRFGLDGVWFQQLQHNSLDVVREVLHLCHLSAEPLYLEVGLRDDETNVLFDLDLADQTHTLADFVF